MGKYTSAERHTTMAKLTSAVVEVKESELIPLIPGSGLDITSIAAAYTDETNTDTQANVSVSASASPIPDEAIFGLFGGLFDDSFNITSATPVVDADGDEAVRFNVVKA